MGETIDPIAQATADAKKEDADQAAADEEVNAGGLMAALRKNRDKRAKKGKPVINDFVEGEDADGVATPPPTEDLAAKAPTEATFDDEADDVFAGNVKKGKGGKKQVEAPAEDGEDGDGGGVKSKKEKEREKKEREKQRKKEQAAKKKTTAPTPAPKAEEKPVEEKKVEADAPETDKAGKKRKVPAHLAAIQKQQEILARQREEEARLEAEERAAEEERLRKEAEEEKKKAEARQRKKEKEKEKKEQLRKEGKLLSDADRKRKQQQELRLQQMLEAGVKVAGLTEKGEEKKKPAFDKKRKGPKKEEIDLEAAAEKARQEAE